MLAAASTTSTSPADVVLFIVVAAVSIAAYWAPTFVAYRRGVRNLGSIAVLNFFAFLLGIPWVIALAMALADPARREAH